VFGITLRPAYNARGKMLLLKEVAEGKIRLGDELIETLFQCTNCGHCVESCPSGVAVPEILKQARKDMTHAGSCHPVFQGLQEVLKHHTNIYGQQELPPWNRKVKPSAAYVYFAGCVGTYRETDATMAALKLLDRLGVDYTLTDEACCSGILEDIGYQINGALAQRNVENLLKTGAGTVITACPYCYQTFTRHPAYAALRDKGINILHLSQFLKDFDFGVKTDKRVTYHDPCDLGRLCGIYDAPREILHKFAPDFVEMAHNRANALCCGAGGGLRGAYPKNSIAIARKRLLEAEEIEAEIVLTDCPSCAHNLSNAKRQRQRFRIYTTPQFICELIERKEEERSR
jgi:Fe-S oxidoreductase